jgi:Right handed beta helix region
MKRRVAVLLFAVVAAVGLSLAPAGAGEDHHGKRRSLVVDDDLARGYGYGHGHAKCRFGRARFARIQDAVDAAWPGATIKVCPGLYQETVQVDEKRLTFLGAQVGEDGRDRSGEDPDESIVEAVTDDAPGTVQLLRDKITWDGFVIRGHGTEDDPIPTNPGMYTSPETSGHSIRNTVFVDNGLGIHLGSDGKRPTTICRNRFAANNEFLGEGQGTGIFSNRGAKDVLIAANRFEDHNTAAILFADHPLDAVVQDDIRVKWNKSVDDLSFATFWATSGLRIRANVVRARVGDELFPGPASAIFIGARNDDVVVKWNRVESASGNGIDVTDSPEPPPHGDLGVGAPTNVSVRGNKVSGAQLSGIHMALGSSGVLVRGNIAVGNAIDDDNPEDPSDCKDSSIGDLTAGTANTWEDNVGGSALPLEICTEPTDADLDDPDHDDEDDHWKRKHRKKHHRKHDRDACGCELPWRH